MNPVRVQAKGQKKEPKSKSTTAAEKKTSVPSTKQVWCSSSINECLLCARTPEAPSAANWCCSVQFVIGDEVFLMNPRAPRQKAAVGKISGILGKHKFHFQDIPENWFKIDVQDVLLPGVKLMSPNADDEHTKIEDVKGTSTVWDQKYLKAIV